MKVGEFIDELLSKYDRDEELYFTTSALDCEWVFDNVVVYAKEEVDDETDVYLTFSEKRKKDFTNAVIEDWAIYFKEELNSVIKKYL